MGGEISEIKMQRTTSVIPNETKRTIFITIPKDINFRVISVDTASGNINIENCYSEFINVTTETGNLLIAGVFEPKNIFIETKSGTPTFKPIDKNKKYSNQYIIRVFFCYNLFLS